MTAMLATFLTFFVIWYISILVIIYYPFKRGESVLVSAFLIAAVWSATVVLLVKLVYEFWLKVLGV